MRTFPHVADAPGITPATGTRGADLVAMGNFGQVMVVSPASDVVIVRLGTDEVRESNASIAARLALVADALSK